MTERERQGNVAAMAARAHEQGQLDLALIRAATGGSVTAIETLVVRLQCVPRMMRAESARTGNRLGPHDLADASQDAMVVTWTKLASFTGTGPLEAWVHRICRLEFLSALRKRRRGAAQACEHCDEVVAAERSGHHATQVERIEAALKLLDGVDAELVRQRLWQELEFTTMAERCSASVAAVKARYYRAVRRLQHLCTRLERLEAR